MAKQPMETAPRDGTEILIYARWDWEGMDGEECNADFAWRVAEPINYKYDDDGNEVDAWASVTENPYTDYAVDPQYWHELPVG